MNDTEQVWPAGSAAEMHDSTSRAIVSVRDGGGSIYWATYIAIALAVLLINIFTQPDRYADYDAYVYYLDTLVHFPPPSWLYFEGFSNIFLLTMHWFTRSVLSAITLAHYLLGIFFVLALPVVFPPRRSSWSALLFCFAMLGSLLAFVTMRATPAYLLIAIGVRFALERRATAWVCLLAASLFHISALLAAGPLALVYFERFLPPLLRADRSRRYYLLLTLAIMVLGALLPQLSSVFTNILQSIPVLSKYDAYTDVQNSDTQIGHYIFLAFVFGLTFAFVSFQRGSRLRLNIYILSSFALYVAMFFSASPIAAFRQAPFWVLPMIMQIEWSRMGLSRGTVPMFVLGCVGLFAYQFGQLYR